MWWMIDIGFSHVLDEENLTQIQEKCLDLDIQATNILFRSLHDCILGEIMDMKTAHEIWSYLNEKYGTASDDDDKPKEGVHEDDEHIHDIVVVEDYSTSWSSDDDDQSTTSSLDNIDGDNSSVANDDSTPSTLDDQVGSCTDDIATSSSSPSSQGDTKVSNCNVIDPNSYEDLLSRYASMTKLFEKVLDKTTK